ncbi:MAG: hypothetical protein CVU89_04360 [Firmicutes bacterium HGW-Firmicutes-14]|nr:MAG: hypothetical protein CVU89_04360 [Firmicutes bacterium HGW-Firmicutes-14]
MNNLKKKFIMLPVMLLFLSLNALPLMANRSFSDLRTNHWSFSVVTELADMGYIKGYPDGTFKPGGNITRAEFIAVMNKLVSDLYPDGTEADNKWLLTDISPNHWAYNAADSVLSHMTKEDVKNIFGSKFSPDRKTTREEVVAVIHAIIRHHADFSGIDLSKNRFSDISDARFRESINLCVEQGIISGYPDGTFKPGGNITRAEIAAILVKVARG